MSVVSLCVAIQDRNLVLTTHLLEKPLPHSQTKGLISASVEEEIEERIRKKEVSFGEIDPRGCNKKQPSGWLSSCDLRSLYCLASELIHLVSMSRFQSRMLYFVLKLEDSNDPISMNWGKDGIILLTSSLMSSQVFQPRVSGLTTWTSVRRTRNLSSGYGMRDGSRGCGSRSGGSLTI